MGKTAYQALRSNAADEIRLAVVAPPFCIVAFSLPVGLNAGISASFFKRISVYGRYLVLMSLAVARNG